MSTSTSDESYLNITAVTAIGRHDAAKELKPAILEALQNNTLSPIRLEGQISARIITCNKSIAQLEEECQFLITKTNQLILALNELKNTSAKNLPEEQYQQRVITIVELIKDLEKIKYTLMDLDRKITYHYDYQEDLFKTIHKQFHLSLAKLQEINQEKVDAILSHLQKQNISVEDASLSSKLLAALNSPQLQAYFMAEAQKSPSKGFAQKLKDWFK